MKSGATDKLYNQIQRHNWLGNMKCTQLFEFYKYPIWPLALLCPATVSAPVEGCWHIHVLPLHKMHIVQPIPYNQPGSSAWGFTNLKRAIMFPGHSVKLTSHPLWEWVNVAIDSCSSLGIHGDDSGVLFFLQTFLAVRLQLIVMLYHTLPSTDVGM